MNDREVSCGRLRQALLDYRAGETDAGMTDPGLIWSAAAGELAPHQVKDLLDQVMESPQTMEAWALAVELQARLPEAQSAGAPRRPRRSRGLWAGILAAAAVLIAGIVVPLLVRQGRETGPVFRGSAPVAGTSRLAEDQALPRERFVLRWTPGPSGSTYDLLVSTRSLEPLYRASGLRRPALQVPRTALEPVADGEPVLWQVTVRLPDGSTLRSGTHVVRVVGPRATVAPIPAPG